MTDPLVTLHHIGKQFGPVTVLQDINLDIRPGEVLGILGENGAGKSTLLKIISGVYQPSQGELVIDGQRFAALDPIRARHQGIAMIPQEFNLVPTLRVFENVFLGQEVRRGGFLDKKAMRRRTVEVLHALQVELDPDARIDRLSVAQKQMVEVARVLVDDARVVILDEPTTVLTETEVQVLFGVVRALQDKGVAVLFISHKLKEVKGLCQRLLILRDGQQIDLCDVGDLTEEDMARKMVGRELSQMFPQKQQHGASVALEVAGLNVQGLLSDINFRLYHGQILGLSGLVGSGRTEIAETLMGLRKKQSGRVMINGQEVNISSPAQAHAHRVAYLSEDRQGKGLVLSFNVMENITLLSLPKYVKGLIRHGAEKLRAQHYQERFSIKAASLHKPVRL
ncbi:MAG: sugar ABC transporter ATP-binding protein, partial [Natronospirillum sp.]